MKAHLQALGAASSLYSLSLLRLIFWIGSGIFVSILIVIGLLAYCYSGWWWLFALPPIIFFTVFCFLCLFARIIARKISPQSLTSEQKKQVKAFNQKAQAVIEQTQTSYFFIAFQLIKDFVVHREARSIKHLIDDSTSLKGDFQKLVTFFE